MPHYYTGAAWAPGDEVFHVAMVAGEGRVLVEGRVDDLAADLEAAAVREGDGLVGTGWLADYCWCEGEQQGWKGEMHPVWTISSRSSRVEKHAFCIASYMSFSICIIRLVNCRLQAW